MSESSTASDPNKINRSLNSFATQSFRNQADRDYIAARLACRFELFPQFLWSSQQAVEKYLKAILLYNRVKATDVRHDIEKAMSLAETLPFKIELSARSQLFIRHVARFGEHRYIDVPYYIEGHPLVDLDLTVWEIRRYCQVLTPIGMSLPPEDLASFTKAKADELSGSTEPRFKFRLQGGFLEEVVDQRRHPCRSALLWQNAVYGARKRSSVRVKHHFQTENPLLYVHPEILNELLKFVFIPPKLWTAYTSHLEGIGASHKSRP